MVAILYGSCSCNRPVLGVRRITFRTITEENYNQITFFERAETLKKAPAAPAAPQAAALRALPDRPASVSAPAYSYERR